MSAKKRVKMTRAGIEMPLGEPTSHSLAEESEKGRWMAAAAAQGEKIHWAVLMVKNVRLEITTPYAECDHAADLFPDMGKFVMTGVENNPDEITCTKCRELYLAYKAGTYDPTADVS